MNQRGGENEIESEELDVKIRSNKKIIIKHHVGLRGYREIEGAADKEKS